MNRYIFLIFIILLTFSQAGAQKTVVGRSEPTRIILTPEFKRGIPPNLFLDIEFKDDNYNKILEADESARLILNIRNEGKGPAQGLEIRVTDASADPNLVIQDGVKIPFLYPGQNRVVNIPIHAKRLIGTGDHNLNITISEYFGYDMDPARLILTSMEYLKPELAFLGVELVDAGPGTGPIVEDGRLQAGEQVKVKVVIQNIGQNLAYSSSFKVNSKDSNIYLNESEGDLGDIAIGEVREFWITLSPNKRVETKGKLPVYLTVTNRDGYGNLVNFQLPVELDQKPPAMQVHEVKADVQGLITKVTRFEINSSKIKANVGSLINIHQVPPSKTRRSDAIGIVIGLEAYQNIAPAPYAATDARIMAKYFRDVLGINQVFEYTNDQVTGFFFENKFNPQFGELQRAVVKGQTEVFVFYSGHGLPSKEGDKVFLIPADGRTEALEIQGYDLNKLYQNLDALNARSVTVFLDACFSGESRATEAHKLQNLVAMKGALIVPKLSKPWETNPSFRVFSSSEYNQTSLGYDDSGTGLFTYYLCAGLQGNADRNGDKKISAAELSGYVIRMVKETSVKIRGLQSPIFNGNPDYILAEY